MERPLRNKSALVTGGTRGIGRAIAARLLLDGAEVTVTGSKPGGHGPDGTKYEACDFSDRDAVIAFADRVRENAPDILVNNAGINIAGPFETYPLEDFEKVLQVNLISTFLLCQAVTPAMKARQWGRIVNLSSIVGHVGREHRAAYGASKFAIDGLTKSLAGELAEFGIIANCVAPGTIITEMSRGRLGEAGIKKMSEAIAVQRCGDVDEVAALVAFLVGPENTFVVAENILADGGYVRCGFFSR